MTHNPKLASAESVAGDVMTARVIFVSADATVQSVAKLLFDNGVGAVPVVDAAGLPVGMASDGDLLGRREKPEHRDWWLDMIAADKLPEERIALARDRPVREVMTSPIVTIGPATPVHEIARLMTEKRIKRLPVIQDGKLIGLVSRADLLSIFETMPRAGAGRAEDSGFLGSLLQSFAGSTHHAGAGNTGTEAALRHDAQKDQHAASAEDFRTMVSASKHHAADEAAAAKRAAALASQLQVRAVLEQRVTGVFWQQLLDKAALAAKHGDKEMLLLRFPADVCSDGGRSVIVAEDGWGNSLRGEAAEIYARWEHDLQPKGFGLNARVESFDNGMVGDFGLFLTWGQ